MSESELFIAVHVWTNYALGVSLCVKDFRVMQKLVPVEDARALFHEAKDWSLWKWLTEKRRVRKIADAAVAAFDEQERKVKSGWSDEMWRAYRELEAAAAANGDPRSKRQYQKAKEQAEGIDAKLKAAVKRVKEADDAAYKARMDAEETFDVAERRLSAGTARQGAQLALDSYDVRETAIRKAEALAKRQ